MAKEKAEVSTPSKEPEVKAAVKVYGKNSAKAKRGTLDKI